MITEIRIGDYIEKSELDTEQKYNDVVEVFKFLGVIGGLVRSDYATAFGDSSNDNSLLAIHSTDTGLCLGYVSGYRDLYCARKLTYRQVMSLKKVDNYNEPKKDGNKYHREIIGFCGTKVEVDIYRVLDAYKTGSASLDHAAKKVLCAGLRGHKDFITDIDNAIESLQEAKALHLQKMEIDNA
ncbi:MAG: hypothetical protein Unbinned6284contig1001_28 [Prokaryotic dsDNA virus sp.]|nr:MAG: hypothetical protein Unbinned6284contig1001_28 [Prokaryotic dsDNA virus sp.]|tara:strand:- start:1827 stop:2375 length:549 start_codon:yes stop_codon:yes gene_type:complete